MHSDMSKETKQEVLARLRRRYATAGAPHKGKLLDQAVEVLGYHRKAAIRALRQPQHQEAALANRMPLSSGQRPVSYQPRAERVRERRPGFPAPCALQAEGLRHRASHSDHSALA